MDCTCFCTNNKNFKYISTHTGLAKLSQILRHFPLYSVQNLIKTKPLCSLASLVGLVMRTCFPDDSIDFKSKWKSADNY